MLYLMTTGLERHARFDFTAYLISYNLSFVILNLWKHWTGRAPAEPLISSFFPTDSQHNFCIFLSDG